MKLAKSKKPVPKKHKGGRPTETVIITIDKETKEAIKQMKVTKRQAKLIEIAKENIRKGKKETVGAMLLKAGYSKHKSESPTSVIKSRTMREILETDMSDDKIIKEHEKLFRDTTKQIKFPIVLTDEEIKDIVEQNGDKLKKICEMPENAHKIAYVICPDKEYIVRAIDIAYKLKGSYAPVKTDNLNKNIDLVALFTQAMQKQNESDTL